MVALNEVLTPHVWLPPAIIDKWQHLRDHEDRSLDVCAFLADIVASMDVPVCIIELKFNQLQFTVAYYMKQLRAAFMHASFVILVRANTLRRTLSHIRCVTLGVVHANEYVPSDHSGRVEIDATDVHDYSYEACASFPIETLFDIDVARHIYLEELARVFGGIYITYESFAENVAWAAGRVRVHCDLLEPDIPIASPWIRTGNAPIASLLINADEIRAALAGTKHEWMLD